MCTRSHTATKCYLLMQCTSACVCTSDNAANSNAFTLECACVGMCTGPVCLPDQRANNLKTLHASFHYTSASPPIRFIHTILIRGPPGTIIFLSSLVPNIFFNVWNKLSHPLQTQDFKIRFASIQRIFILPKSATPHTQTYYTHILCQVWWCFFGLLFVLNL